MKTTLELPDELFREVKQLARDQGVTMRELVTEGLRRELARRRAPDPRADFVFPTFDGGSGLQRGVRPEDIIEMSYGDRL